MATNEPSHLEVLDQEPWGRTPSQVPKIQQNNQMTYCEQHSYRHQKSLCYKLVLQGTIKLMV